MNEKNYDQQVLEWRFHQIQLRRKYKGTPAGFQDRQAELTAITEWKKDVLKFRKENIQNIQSLYQPMPQPFVGRKQELSEIERTMQAPSGTAILYGIGGIGKTALMREYLRIHRNDYDGIVYLTFSKSVKNTLCNDTMLNISNLNFRPEKHGSLSKYYDLKLHVLQEIIKKGKYLLLLDDCNTQTDPDLDDFLNLSCHKIITTRVNPQSWGYSGIEVLAFSTYTDWCAFLDLYTKEPLPEDEKKEIKEYIGKVHGHTLAAMLRISNRNAEWDTADIGKNLLQSFSLKKRELELLMYLSIMPTDGVPFSLFQTITQLKKGELRRLEDFMLIQIDRFSAFETEKISLHPLITEATKETFPANAINCRHLIKGMENYLNGENPQHKDIWEISYEDNRKIEPYVFALVNTFTEPVPWMAATFDRLATFLWIQGYFQEAEAYSLKIYNSVKAYYGENHQLTGRMAIRTGAVYYNQMDWSNANVWYLKGLDAFKKCKPANQDYLYYFMQALAIVARMYRHEHEYEAALAAIDEALECFHKFKKQYEEKNLTLTYAQLLEYPYYLNSKVNILLEMGQFEEAEQLSSKALKAFEDVSDDEFRKNTFRSVQIEILIRKKSYEKAAILAEENLRQALLYRGEKYKDTLMYMEKLADLQKDLHKETEAAALYQKILQCLHLEYPYQENWIAQIHSKLNC